MQYAILIYEKDSDFSARSDGQRQGSYWAGWQGRLVGDRAALSRPRCAGAERRRPPWPGGRSCRTDGAARALALIDEISPALVAAHQPYWALRADLLRRLGRTAEAREAYERSLGLKCLPAIQDDARDRSR